MDEKLQPLFTPWHIGAREGKNRVVLASMGKGRNIRSAGDDKQADNVRTVIWDACGAAMEV